MRLTQHPSCNDVLGAPRDWDQGQLPCSALPITRGEVDGVPVVVSFWRPCAAELAALNAGGLVALSIVGHSHAPVMVGVAP